MRFVFVLGLALSCCLLWAQSPKQATNNEIKNGEKAKAGENQQQAKAGSPSFAIGSDPRAQKHYTEHDGPGETNTAVSPEVRLAEGTDSLARYTGLLAFFTFALVAVAAFQYFAMRKHAEHLESLNKRASENALAAKRSADVAERQLRETYRASVQIENARFEGSEFCCDVKNIGATKAKRVRVYGCVASGPITDTICELETRESRTLSAAPSNSQLTECGELLRSEWVPIKRYGAPIWEPLWATIRVEYSDIFNVEHVTLFGFLLQRDGERIPGLCRSWQNREQPDSASGS